MNGGMLMKLIAINHSTRSK